MSTITAPPQTASYVRRALYGGLLLTVVATLAPVVDLMTVDTIGDHVRAAYPDWSADAVAKDRNAITIYLVAVGLLGLVGWVWSIVAVARGSRRLRAICTTLFVVGATVQLIGLSVGGEAYTTIVPPLHGVSASCRHWQGWWPLPACGDVGSGRTALVPRPHGHGSRHQ